MIDLNPSRNLAARPRVGCFFALFLLAGWLAASASAGVVFTSLYSFTGGNDGANPVAGLAKGSDGNFYGTTYYGGTNAWGTVFKISTNGALSSLYSFTGINYDAYPTAGLVQGSDGYFYGTTSGYPLTDGNVFKISTNGTYTSLHSFTGINEGLFPDAGLVQGSDGNFYGTTTSSGPFDLGYGSVFKISTNGTLTNLYSFDYNDGSGPYAGLLQGSDGSFYGTTSFGGTNGGFGTVFQISTNGALTSLNSFDYYNDGEGPYAGLVQASD